MESSQTLEKRLEVPEIGMHLATWARASSEQAAAAASACASCATLGSAACILQSKLLGNSLPGTVEKVEAEGTGEGVVPCL
jgi:hypothetical protein